jgi:uncharacterized protein (TIGR03083 family)
MRPAAKLLLIESSAIGPVLDSLDEADFDRPTICTGWSVRDVVAHCAAALTMVATNAVHSFSPADNERDVAERRVWPLSDVLSELYRGYEVAAATIDRAGGPLDGVGVGEWMHGGDIRDAVGAAEPYASAGIDLAEDLLIERSRTLGRPGVTVVLPRGVVLFGAEPSGGHLVCDRETFVRLCGGRRPDPTRFTLRGVDTRDLVLFT